MRRLPIPEYIPEGRLHVLNVDHMIKALTMFLETKVSVIAYSLLISCHCLFLFFFFMSVLILMTLIPRIGMFPC